MKFSRSYAARSAPHADSRRLGQRAALLAAGAVFACLLLYAILRQFPQPVPTLSLPEHQSGRPIQTLYRVAEAASREGWSPALRLLSGDLWQEAGQPQRALADWRIASASLVDAALEQHIAQTAFALGDWQTALQAWQRAVSLAPADAALAHDYALLLAALSPSAAEAALLQAASGSPDQTALHSALLQAIAAGGSEHERLMRAGMVFADHARWLHARAAFQSAAASGSDALALAYLGYAIDQTGGDGSAQIAAAVQAAPGQPQVRLLEGLHLRARQDFAGSLAALSTAALLDPSSPALLAELGTAHLLAGDYTAARYWYEQAVLRSGGAEPFVQLLQSLQSAQEISPDQPAEATTDEAPQHTAPDVLPDDTAQPGAAG